jgi:N-acetylglucosaminyldiphosphoundecaprenol N-acetyl-beta-D-mannosaminyltransferase
MRTVKPLFADNWDAPIAPVFVAEIPVAPLSTQQWIDLMLSDHRAIKRGEERTQYHAAINGNCISAFARESRFRNALAKADAIAADGVPVMLAARLLAKRRIPDRAATTDLFHDLAQAASDAGLSMYFLGATEEENKIAVDRVRTLYPRLQIAGRHHGYFGKDDEPDIIATVNASKPDIVWLALGMPREDIFASRYRDHFPGVTWIKTCGGLFNFLSGSRSRAPQWMQNNGLEWLYRTALEPRRLFWRYLTTNIHAIWLMITRR